MELNFRCLDVEREKVLIKLIGEDNISEKGGKRSLPFLLAIWGSGGRRFKSSHPDFNSDARIC